MCVRISGNIPPSIQFDGLLERGRHHQSVGLRERRVRTNPEGTHRLRSGHRFRPSRQATR